MTREHILPIPPERTPQMLLSAFERFRQGWRRRGRSGGGGEEHWVEEYPFTETYAVSFLFWGLISLCSCSFGASRFFYAVKRLQLLTWVELLFFQRFTVFGARGLSCLHFLVCREHSTIVEGQRLGTVHVRVPRCVFSREMNTKKETPTCICISLYEHFHVYVYVDVDVNADAYIC